MTYLGRSAGTEF